MGVKFGVHQNAYTSFHETVYELHVPIHEASDATNANTNATDAGSTDSTDAADSWDLLRSSLKILRSLALEMRISDADVDAGAENDNT